MVKVKVSQKKEPARQRERERGREREGEREREREQRSAHTANYSWKSARGSGLGKRSCFANLVWGASVWGASWYSGLGFQASGNSGETISEAGHIEWQPW